MFVGHYGPSLAAKAAKNSTPLWVLFIAVQLLDVCWSFRVLLGIEKVRIVPGITATSPLDLYYMPYTHGFIGAALWSIAAGNSLQGCFAKPKGGQPPHWLALPSSLTGCLTGSSIAPICRCTIIPSRWVSDSGTIRYSPSCSKSLSSSAGCIST
jgi:hypothetical protein